MVAFSVIEGPRLDDLGGDLPKASCRQRLLIGACAGVRRRCVGRIGQVDPGAILRADVIALPHALRRVVALPEGFQQNLKGDSCGIERHQHHFVMAGAPGAHFLISGVWREPAAIARRCGVNGCTQLPELAFRAPKTTQTENCGLRARRPWRMKAGARNVMGLGRDDGLWPAGQSLLRLDHLRFVAELEHVASLARLKLGRGPALSNAVRPYLQSGAVDPIQRRFPPPGEPE